MSRNSGKYVVTQASGSNRQRMIMQDKLHSRKRTVTHEGLVPGDRKRMKTKPTQSASRNPRVPKESSSSDTSEGGTSESENNDMEDALTGVSKKSDISDLTLRAMKRKKSTGTDQNSKKVKLSDEIGRESDSEVEESVSGTSSDDIQTNEVPSVPEKRTKLSAVGTGDVDSSSESEGDEKSGEEADDEYAAIRKELANMPFDELQKLREKVGSKAYNQALFGKSSGHGKNKRIYKRANKNRPMEMSSKAPVSRYRQKQAKRVTRDPRFDDLSGAYDERLFKRSYAFLDDIKANEKVKLQKKVQKEKDEEKAAHMKYVINRISQQERSNKEKKQKSEHLKAVEKKEKALVKDGKTPFYLKKSEKKKLELAEKFRDLKKSGKLDKYLNRKRKKIASKDRKHLPKMNLR